MFTVSAEAQPTVPADSRPSWLTYSGLTIWFDCPSCIHSPFWRRHVYMIHCPDCFLDLKIIIRKKDRIVPSFYTLSFTLCWGSWHYLWTVPRFRWNRRSWGAANQQADSAGSRPTAGLIAKVLTRVQIDKVVTKLVQVGRSTKTRTTYGSHESPTLCW